VVGTARIKIDREHTGAWRAWLLGIRITIWRHPQNAQL